MRGVKARRERFVEQNLGLVHACAHRFTGKGIEYDDLYSAGCMGLIKAVDAFDEERGVKFSTYAVPVILGEIRRLFRDGGTVKVSRGLKELSMKVAREREKLISQTGMEPTLSQLAGAMQMSMEEVAEAIGAGSPALSLTESEDEGGGQIDVKIEGIEEKLTDKIAVRMAMEKLESRDRQLILLRYFSGRTQVETAKELGMTQVQVSRREKKILLFLRGQLE